MKGFPSTRSNLRGKRSVEANLEERVYCFVKSNHNFFWHIIINQKAQQFRIYSFRDGLKSYFSRVKELFISLTYVERGKKINSEFWLIYFLLFLFHIEFFTKKLDIWMADHRIVWGLVICWLVLFLKMLNILFWGNWYFYLNTHWIVLSTNLHYVDHKFTIDKSLPRKCKLKNIG